MSEKNQQEVEVEESLDLPEVQEGQEDTTDWKTEATKLREKAIAQRERTKNLKQQLAEAKAAKESAAPSQSRPATGELNETQLDYLDLKGISESDDVRLIERHIKNTGETVRQALQDDYIKSKLEANKKTREVQNATPSGKQRSGSGSNDNIEYWFAKNEATGEWPKDFKLKAELLAAKERKLGTNAPAWHQ